MTPERLGALLAEAGLTPACALLRPLGHQASGSGVAASDPGWDVYPASMLKTPLALATLALCAQGELHLEAPHQVTQSNMTVNDKPSPLVPGYAAPLRELLDLAVTRSDNVATNMLYDIVGRDRATWLCRQRFGLHGTAFCRKLSGDYPLISDPEWDGVHMNRHSPRDAARVFELLAQGHADHNELLLDLLARQEWNNKLSEGLQAGDRFAHKTGDTDEVTHDGGILTLETGEAFVLVVYTALPSSDENNARFGAFMARLRDELLTGV